MGLHPGVDASHQHPVVQVSLQSSGWNGHLNQRRTVLQHQSSLSPSSIMNSLVIVLFLSGMVAMIMLRTLHKDIARYNQMDSVVSLRP